MSTPVSPRRHILVVDDEPFVCESVKMLLNFDGHEVQTASNGKEALAILEKEQFDIVFTDFEMPGMKGDELALAIKARNPALPVVMITAYMETMPGGLPGVDVMIGKPFLLASLREAIAKVCPVPLAKSKHIK